MFTRCSVALCVTLLAIGGRDPVRAQSAAPALTLADVIADTLKENPDIRTARETMQAERGALVQTARPFDVRPTATFSGSRAEQQTSTTLTDLGSTYSTLGAESALNVSKMFRSGVGVTSQIAMGRTSLGSWAGSTLNAFSLTSGVTVPLMQGRGGGVLTAAERSAALEYQASGRTLRATASGAVLTSAIAYWAYRAAYERAVIQRAAASRSRQVVDEVNILIAADERPRSDIDLMIANASTKHATEVAAERQIVQARNALAQAIGLPAESAAALAAPTTDFPNPDETVDVPLDVLVADAFAHHDQLAAAITRQESAQTLRAGALSQMTARVDLVLGTSYTGRLDGSNLGRAFGAVYRNVLGPNVSVQFQIEPASSNSSLRGSVIAADAAYAQAKIASDELARTIRLTVADALDALHAARAQVADAREAVARGRLALETVKRNFEVGAATLFDRILAEDTVTNAELANLALSQQYATALANLQFARGVLIDAQDADLKADPQRVLHISREDAR